VWVVQQLRTIWLPREPMAFDEHLPLFGRAT
jgi:hypothetical protein